MATNKVKREIERIFKEDEDYVFVFQDYPDHKIAMNTIIEGLVENPKNYSDFKILEEGMKVDSDGYPYIVFMVIFEDGTELEMVTFHQGNRWNYYAKF